MNRTLDEVATAHRRQGRRRRVGRAHRRVRHQGSGAGPSHVSLQPEVRAPSLDDSRLGRDRGWKLGRPRRAPGAPTLLVTDNAYAAFARAMDLLVERDETSSVRCPPVRARGRRSARSARAWGSVRIAVVLENAEIGRPQRRSTRAPTSGATVRIGSDCVIYPNVVIKSPTVLGDRVIVHAGAVIGTDGFGFAREGDGAAQGARSSGTSSSRTTSRSARTSASRAPPSGTTRIGRGTKIDNLVQIAHNVVIGEDSIVVAQVGICGSAEIGRRVVIAGQAGIGGHLRSATTPSSGRSRASRSPCPRGSRCRATRPGSTSLSKRLNACIQALPALLARVRELEKRLSKIEKEDEC